jgi:hypothetical protein
MTATFQPVAHTAWALAMFLALAALLKWKHRRMWVEHRINRCLRAYASTEEEEQKGGWRWRKRSAAPVTRT